MEIANIFWQGELTKLERASIKSFIDHGFQVKLWSYNNLQVDVAESCDASLVIPESKMSDIAPSYIDGVLLKKATSTHFSDMFRYYLINKFDGWWFDADCICLKDAEEFKELRKEGLVAGYLEHIETEIANGVLYVNKDLSSTLLKEFEEFMADENRDTSWGSSGPKYIAAFINRNGLVARVLPYTMFYNINWDEFNLFTDPQLLSDCKERIKDSYIVHIWNTEFERRNIDKNNPIENSFLYELYLSK